MQQFADPAGQSSPVVMRQVKMGTQIQQRALLDGRAHAHRLHQAMGEVRFSGLAVTGVGAANEHARRVPGHSGQGNREIYFMALHILPLQNPQIFRQFFMPNQAETGRIPQILAKMGYEGMTPEQTKAFAAELIQQMQAKGVLPAAPGAEQRVTGAITDIARGASAGDKQLQRALGLLQAGDVAQAAQLLQAVADEKTARIQQDSKDAATAYRNLGAIAGLGDPKRALDAYRKTIELDPSDAESLLWVGWIELERGHLDEAEQRFRRLLELAAGDSQARNRYWATLGLGDIRRERGNLPEALKSYRDGLAIRDRLAKSDPGNAGWQRDLSVAFNKVGDVLVARGNLPEALKSYRDGLAIRDRLAKPDPGNADWQRDLSVSDNKIGDVLEAQGNLPEALKSYHDDLAIADRLAKADPGNAGWQRDLSVSYEKV